MGQQIGIKLELEGSEVSVENFSADILAKNPQDNTLVLIENQLENSDHNHLGQIMTYLAGLEAKVIIWIAKGFHEAHLSAIRWLNEHTDDSFSFFAITVKVVQIENSPLAPVFEIVARPNQWERRLQAVAQEKRSSSALTQFRKAFWDYYVSKYPKIADDATSGANSNRWRKIESLDLIISSYLSKDGVGLFIRSRFGDESAHKTTYETLQRYEDILAERLGVPMGANEKYFFSSDYNADATDQSRWDELVDWLYEKTEAYEQALMTLENDHNS